MKGNRLGTSGVVLCGGRSRRMGRAKALLPWRGGTLLEYVVSVLREVTDDVVVVSSEELELPPVDARVVRDREPQLGPLAGIREGLEAATGELAFVTSTDAPFLTPGFVRHVLSFGTAAAPVVGGFVQTLAAAYPRALAETAGELIAAGRLRPLFLLEAAGFRSIAAEELPDLDSLRNVNTPDAYLEALAEDGAQSPVTVELLGLARRKTGLETVDVGHGSLQSVVAELEARCPQLELDIENPGFGYLLSLDGREFLRDPNVVLGPGERLVVLDAAVGG